MNTNLKTTVDKDGYHITMPVRENAQPGPAMTIHAHPMHQTPEIPHPVVQNGENGRVVVSEGAHRLADQLQRQGACIVRHQVSGELFAVVKFTDGSVRRWS